MSIMIFRRIFSFLPFLPLISCSAYSNANESDDNMRNLTRAATALMQTTTNPLGSFRGDKIPSLQINDLDPGEYTLEFQVVEPPIDPEDFGAYAFINWKVDGQQIQRIINVFSGAVISGVANAVDVQLLDQSGRGIGTNVLPNASVVNGSPLMTFAGPVSLQQGQQIIVTTTHLNYTVAVGVTNNTIITLDRGYEGPTSGLVNSYSLSPYKVAATLSKGSRPTIMQPPTLLTDLSLITIAPAGLPRVIPIPQDAGIISVLVTVIAGVGAQTESLNGWADFLNKSGSTVLGNFVPNYFSGWFPIPVGAATIRLHNESVGSTLAFSMQWGIEG